jgi:type I restriction enzyme R subunit
VSLAQKARRVVPWNFTFVVMTNQEELETQIFQTFVGCGPSRSRERAVLRAV